MKSLTLISTKNNILRLGLFGVLVNTYNHRLMKITPKLHNTKQNEANNCSKKGIYSCETSTNYKDLTVLFMRAVSIINHPTLCCFSILYLFFYHFSCQESIVSISFSNKGSRYLCSGGSGQIVRIWDLQRKKCIKWLAGHSDTITGVMYNCRDEYLASISVRGDLILHNLASGARTTEVKDPHRQVISYSWHKLVSVMLD